MLSAGSGCLQVVGTAVALLELMALAACANRPATGDGGRS